MQHRAISIARFTLLEGMRTRFVLTVGVVITAVLIAAEFSAGLAITETHSYRVSVYAALLRISMVFVMILFVATSVVREVEERLLDLTLSRPVSRASWYLGRLGGYIALVLGITLAGTIPLVMTAGALPA